MRMTRSSGNNEKSLEAEESKDDDGVSEEPESFEDDEDDDDLAGQKDEQTRVGRFQRANGEASHFAVVPPSHITSNRLISQLMKIWNLPNPSFILELNLAADVPAISEEHGSELYVGIDELSNDMKKDHSVEDINRFLPVYLRRKILSHLTSLFVAMEMVRGCLVCYGSPSKEQKELVEEALAMACAAPTILVLDSERHKPGSETEGPGHRKAVLDQRYTLPIREVLKDASSLDSVHKIGLEDSGAPTVAWIRGTHFIFSSGYDRFRPQLLAPTGQLILHGASATGLMLRDAVMYAKPCIICGTTGAETHAYCRLISEIQRLHKERSDAINEKQTKTFPCGRGRRSLSSAPLSEASFNNSLRLELRQKASQLREHAIAIQSGNTEINTDESDTLDLASVLQFIDLYCDNPRSFQKIVVSIDPTNRSPEETVHRVAQAFSEPLINYDSTSDITAVEQAWRSHWQLEKCETKNDRLHDTVDYMNILASFLATVFAVLVTEEGSLSTWISTSLAGVVFVTSVFLLLSTRGRKASRILAAQASIVHEIFCFRMRIGKYSLVGAGRTLSISLHRCRMTFSRSIESILISFAHTGFQTGGFDRTDLLDYVAETLHIAEDDWLAREVALSGSIHVVEYYNLRVKNFLNWLDQEERRLSAWTWILLIGSIAASAGAVVLGAAGGIAWVPIAVASTTGLLQLLKVNEYERLHEQLSSMQSLAEELRAFGAWWSSLSSLEQTMRRSIVHLVTVCELLALKVETSCPLFEHECRREFMDSAIPLWIDPSTVTGERKKTEV